jgi:predicted ArsR family transcriptional regulator
MDPYDEEILKALEDGNSSNFNKILDTVSFSHNTLRLHLNSMVEKGLIIREKPPSKRRGRPTYLYRASAEALASAPGVSGEVVALNFSDLKRLCRYQTGGRCRETRDRCEPEFCPQIMKGD